VVKYVTEQCCVYGAVRDRKVFTVELSIINRRFGSCTQIDPDDGGSDRGRQVMGDEAVAATHIEYTRIGRNHARDFERHVISTANLATPALATPAPLNAVQ
jgi:hypothetical protein